MAIAYNSSVDGGNNGGSTNNHTFAFNNVGGNILFVGFLGDSDSGFNDITGVTYNGVSLSLVDSWTASGSFVNRYTYLYMLQNPALGSNNVVVNCTNNHYLFPGAVSYIEANLTGQPDAHTTNLEYGVSSSTTSLTTIADNCWLMAIGGGTSSTPNAGAGTTRRTFEAAFGGWGLFDSNSAKTPAGSASLVVTTSGAENIVTVMASFAPSADPVLKQTHYRWRSDDEGLLGPA